MFGEEDFSVIVRSDLPWALECSLKFLCLCFDIFFGKFLFYVRCRFMSVLFMTVHVTFLSILFAVDS